MTDLQLVSATISGFTIPDTFIPTILQPQPVAPQSLQSMFGDQNNSPQYWDVFQSWYDQINNIWLTPDLNIAPQQLRDDVAAQLALIIQYNTDLLNWNLDYEVQREVQWRNKLAIAILS